jgi:hypothetical protein
MNSLPKRGFNSALERFGINEAFGDYAKSDLLLISALLRRIMRECLDAVK